MTLDQYLTLGMLVFCIGVFGVLTRRNAIGVLISVELMFNAVNLVMVAFTRFISPSGLEGQVFAVFIIVIAAAETTVGMAIVLLLYRGFRGILVDRINMLKW
jgi:NAD(P)H-quinone oxidoreductase subunit 4L